MTAFLVAMASFGVVAAGCTSHGDVPAPLDVVYPPVPSNLVITNPQDLDYDFVWSIDDPTDVKGYRIYLLGEGLVPDDMIGESVGTSFQATMPFKVTGARFAVSAISVDNVEGVQTSAVAP